MTPLQVLLSAFGISSFAGIAALLRSNQPLTARAILSAATYSGAMGFIIGSLWMKQYGIGDPYFLFGVAGLAGIGGVTAIDLVIIAAKKSGIKLVLSRDEPAVDNKP